MKLAEALVLRADLQKRIEQLRERLKASALVQEGEEPAEDPTALLAELKQLLAQLTGMVQRINRTNVAVRLPDGQTLMEALAARAPSPCTTGCWSPSRPLLRHALTGCNALR